MRIKELDLVGVKLITFDRYSDERGHFNELICSEVQNKLGVHQFRQINQSSSKPGVFRGMHLQRSPFGQAKLVFCLGGSILDFVLDVSPTSATFGQHISVELSEHVPNAIFIPAHYAHGFLAGEKGASVLYATSQDRSADHEVSINFASTSVSKNLKGVSPLLSEKDKTAISLDDFVARYASHESELL